MWAILGSLVVHGLVLSGMLRAALDHPVRQRVVVPVEAVTLVPLQTGPNGGGGGRPAPVTKPETVAEKPVVAPKPKPRVKPRPRTKARPTPPPEPAKAPVITSPAPPPAATGKAKAAETAGAASRTGASGVAGTGAGGRGGGRGTGSGGGLGQGQGRGSGAGSALQGYLGEVRRILEKHKDYPLMARRRNIQGVVVVVFTVAAAGQVEAFRIKHSSGHDLLDEGAQNTIHRVGHFPPFPAALDRQRLTIEVPLAFRLNNNG